MALGEPLRSPSDSLLSAKVSTKFRRKMAVDQSVYFACRLKVTEFVLFCCWRNNILFLWTVWCHCLVEAVNRRLPTAVTPTRSQLRWDLLCAKWHRSRFSSSTSVSPAKSYSVYCPTLIFVIIHSLGPVQAVYSRRSNKWTQSQLNSGKQEKCNKFLKWCHL
jgi:hypothetical protein